MRLALGGLFLCLALWGCQQKDDKWERFNHCIDVQNEAVRKTGNLPTEGECAPID